MPNRRYRSFGSPALLATLALPLIGLLAVIGALSLSSADRLSVLPSLAVAGVPTQVELLPGQDVYVLIETPIPIGVRVLDAAGLPVAEVLVTFRVQSGSGILKALLSSPICFAVVKIAFVR